MLEDKKTVVLLLCDKRTDADEVVKKYAPTDVWTLNNCFKRQSTQHFQLHGFKTMLEAHGKDYFKKLGRLTVPLVLFPLQAQTFSSFTLELYGYHIPSPLIRTFVVEEVIELGGRPYLDNSVDWMTAIAILEGYKRIILTGVSFGESATELWKVRERAADLIEFPPSEAAWKHDKQLVDDLRGMHAGDESWAIPCISYWAGIAQGRGVEFIVEGKHHGLFYDRWSKGVGSALYGIDPRAGGL